MAAVEDCSALLLAAGLSRRFGSDDKLASDYRGRPLVQHAADTLAGLGFARRLAVVNSSGPVADMLAAAGFDIVLNQAPEDGLSSSIRLGIMELARDGRPVLIALGDMPLVPGRHFAALCAALSDTGAIAASYGLGKPTVPAAFSTSTFPDLLDQSGDAGAQRLLASAVKVPVSSDSLLDIDRRDDLAAVGQA